MPWKHAGRQDYNLEDSKIFMEWAKHSGTWFLFSKNFEKFRNSIEVFLKFFLCFPIFPLVFSDFHKFPHFSPIFPNFQKFPKILKFPKISFRANLKPFKRSLPWRDRQTRAHCLEDSTPMCPEQNARHSRVAGHVPFGHFWSVSSLWVITRYAQGQRYFLVNRDLNELC